MTKNELGRIVLAATDLTNTSGLGAADASALALHALELMAFAERVARLNRDDPGMLANLVDEARRLSDAG